MNGPDPMNGVDYVFGAHQPAPGTLTEVADGIYWARMPLPFVLDHVFVYLLADGDGWTVVDTGLGNAVTLDLWRRILAGAPHGRPVRRVIVTHFHPDHIGMAGWFMEGGAGEFWMSRAEWLNARAGWLDASAESAAAMETFYRRTGIQQGHIEQYRAAGNVYRGLVRPVPGAYRRIAPATRFEIDGHEWLPLLGGGHSPEHVCLYCESKGVLIGGDLLLPRITPNISVWPNEPEANPLADYLAFLGGLDAIAGDVLVLPSHDRPYRGLHRRAAAIAAHHRERLETALDSCRQPATAADIMRALWRRELDTYQIRFAIGEALAHIHVLMGAGEVARELGPDGVYRYRRTTAQ